MRVALALVAASICIVGAQASAQTMGKVRLCRRPGVTELQDHKSVPVPMGTGFTSGDDKFGDQLKPFFEIHTTEPAFLPPKPGCVVIPAVLDRNPSGFALTTHYPASLPSQLNVAGLTVFGRVAADFK